MRLNVDTSGDEGGFHWMFHPLLFCFVFRLWTKGDSIKILPVCLSFCLSLFFYFDIKPHRQYIFALFFHSMSRVFLVSDYLLSFGFYLFVSPFVCLCVCASRHFRIIMQFILFRAPALRALQTKQVGG
ncbi:hypothetical protein, unlikely [Trypanosoma brucei gambiense DAL972]|uniref:Uncharacterized protein n=1 Tax=Trypanosoma brucei gambiense (strain MHOM/CI/86/DAL972) TaxID=679716 RepID=D0A231_TRYB9|nr:hypothetical protein, unlikely [Trypanosoma brucei gambiense DAL972]CBH15324.1 hypothetical protein, unlikely [Trypanosoma brucei gambiense DAL972]|eukprot:XP_011777589.1 hypothetical protein, unlikely [Trypanosoma brucei gambiense DAL972]